MEKDTAFQMGASNIRFGKGITREIGMDLAEMSARNVMVVTDPGMTELPVVQTVLDSLETNRIPYTLFAQARVEPTDASVQEAITFATEGDFDAYVAVGGGSSIDTAKVANLYATYPPEDFFDYVNAPIGKGLAVPGPVKPLIAIPTTAGTGSETTGVAIFDVTDMHAKTGIAHRRLKPVLGLLDPENTRTQPREVAASAGLDVLCHAIESLTAIPYTERPRPATPAQRSAYQGSNPISDIWVEAALRLAHQYLQRAAADPEDDEARSNMMLAAAYAGLGFGNAGCHLPHGMSYPVAGMVRGYHHPGYPDGHAMVPHGVSVILNAPAVFRFTAPACPERHLNAAHWLGADISRARPEDAGAILADTLIDIMQRLKIPNGLAAVGYTAADIPALVQGTLPQHRVTKLSPRPAGEEDLSAIFEDALTYW